MRLVQHLREWSASTGEWSAMCETQYQVSAAPTVEARMAAGRRMAVLLESYAARMERSALVRFIGPGLPETLRAEAGEYRAGRDPHADYREQS